MKRWLNNSILICLLSVIWFASSAPSYLPPIIVEESDGSPSVKTTTKIITPNGWLTQTGTRVTITAAGVSGSIDASAITTGTLAVARGGTGKTSWTQYLIPYADTTTSFAQIAIGTSGQVLTSNGAGAAPTFQTVSSISGLTTNGAVYAASATTIASTAALTSGQLLVGSTGVAPVAATLTGTANRVTVTNGAGTITLSGPQDLATTSSPTFGGLTVNGTIASEVSANVAARNFVTSNAWISQTSAADNDWRDIVWSPELGLFAAVADSGVGNRVMTSPDGITWTSRTSAANVPWNTIEWSPALNLFAALSNTGAPSDTVMTSPDGITWTLRTAATALWWRDIAWSPGLGLFAAVSSTGTAAQMVMTSPDGITWTSRTAAAAVTWQSIVWSPELGLFAAVSSTGTAAQMVMTSPDGITWTSRTAVNTNSWQSIAWSPELGLFAAGSSTGAGNRIMTSSDGITWTSRTAALIKEKIVWSPQLGLFVAISPSGSGSDVETSPDGITWTQRTTVTGNAWRGLAWSPQQGRFAAVSSDGTGNRVMTSIGTAANGLSMSEVQTGTLALARGGTAASLTASNGGIFYSTATAGAILAGTATAGQILRSGASTAPTWSTATYPAVATGVGTILRANGTNWLASTLTIPDTAAINTLLYASAANVISALATANNGILATGATGIPALVTDIPTAVTIGGAAIYRVAGTDVAVADGGTGVGSWTNGQLLIGNTIGNTAALATLTGTANQITVTNGASAITLATPQDIAAASSPTFAGLTVTSNIAATATTLGFYGVAAVTRPLAYTQTYTLADKTHAGFTSADLATTAATQTTPWGFATAAQADNIATQFNALRVDVTDLKQLVNAIIDDLQSLGLQQ